MVLPRSHYFHHHLAGLFGLFGLGWEKGYRGVFGEGEGFSGESGGEVEEEKGRKVKKRSRMKNNSLN